MGTNSTGCTEWERDYDPATEQPPMTEAPQVDALNELRQRLAVAERLVRVDTALAKRVSEHMRREAELRVWLDNWLKAYPLDIFPQPDLTKAAELLKAGGLTLDAVSAEMARHVLTHVLERLGETP